MFPSLTGAPRRTVRHAGTPRARVLTGGLLAVLFLLVTALTAVLPATPARAAEPDWLNGVERFEPTEATVYLAHGVPNDPTQVSTGTQLTRQRQTSTTFEDLGADSFDRLELVTAFEEEFDATLPDEVLQSIDSVKDAVDAIEKVL